MSLMAETKQEDKHLKNKLHNLATWMLIYNKQMKEPQKLEKIITDYHEQPHLNKSFINGMQVAFEIVFGKREWENYYA